MDVIQPGKSGSLESLESLDSFLRQTGLSDRQKASLVNKAERQLAQQDLYYLASNVLGYKDLFKPYHMPICNALSVFRDQWQLHLHPRGHFKSTIITIAESIQDLLNNPNTTILIVNAILGNSIAFLRELKSHFIYNEKFRSLFPEFAIHDAADEGTTEAFTVVCRDKKWIREASVEVAGIDKAVVSRHYDKIVFDDVVNDKNSSTQEQRQKVFDSYREFLSLLNPPGKVRIVGTRWHYYDLYGNLLENLLKARQNGQKEIFKIFKTEAIDIAGEPVFTPRFSLEFLKQLRDQQGAYIYSCQYLNNPQPDEEKIFSRKDIKFTPKIIVPANTLTHTYVTTDPSVGQSESSDPAVILTITTNSEQEIFITSIVRDWFNPDEFINACLNKVIEVRPIKFAIETVSFQKTLKFFLEKEKIRRQVPVTIEEIKRSTQVSKIERIKRIQPYLKAGKIYLVCDPENLTEVQKQLLEEIDTFPYGRYDDILDALADAIELAKYPGKAVKQTVVYESANDARDDGSDYRTGFRYKARIMEKSRASQVLMRNARIARERIERYKASLRGEQP